MLPEILRRRVHADQLSLPVLWRDADDQPLTRPQRVLDLLGEVVVQPTGLVAGEPALREVDQAVGPLEHVGADLTFPGARLGHPTLDADRRAVRGEGRGLLLIADECGAGHALVGSATE